MFRWSCKIMRRSYIVTAPSFTESSRPRKNPYTLDFHWYLEHGPAFVTIACPLASLQGLRPAQWRAVSNNQTINILFRKCQWPILRIARQHWVPPNWTTKNKESRACFTLKAASRSVKTRLTWMLLLGPMKEGSMTPPVTADSCCFKGVKANVVAPVSISAHLYSIWKHFFSNQSSFCRVLEQPGSNECRWRSSSIQWTRLRSSSSSPAHCPYRCRDKLNNLRDSKGSPGYISTSATSQECGQNHVSDAYQV